MWSDLFHRIAPSLWRRVPVVDGGAVALARRRDELAFLPAALELLETPVPPARRWLLWSVIALLVAAATWATFGKVDVVAIAEGKVLPAGQSKLIQPIETSLVKAILVSNGQHVRRGQTLIELDAGQAADDADKARSTRIEAMLAASQAQALLRAQERQMPPVVEAVADAGAGRQMAIARLAASQYDEFHSKDLALRAELHKREQDRRAAVNKIAALRIAAPIAQQVADDLYTLVQQNFVSRHAYLDKRLAALNQAQELQSELDYADSLQHAIDEQRQNIVSLEAQFRRSQLDAWSQAQQQLAQARADEHKLSQRTGQARLTAPVNGTVQQLAVHTVGGVVTPAQTLLVIVPDHAPLEVEAQLLNRDVGFVRPGQVAAVKLEAYPYTRYGTLRGTIRTISQEAVTDEKLGLVYPLRVELASSAIVVDGARLPLAPGMVAIVEVKTEQRRIIEYLLTPLSRYRHEAMREQ